MSVCVCLGVFLCVYGHRPHSFITIARPGLLLSFPYGSCSAITHAHAPWLHWRASIIRPDALQMLQVFLKPIQPQASIHQNPSVHDISVCVGVCVWVQPACGVELEIQSKPENSRVILHPELRIGDLCPCALSPSLTNHLNGKVTGVNWFEPQMKRHRFVVKHGNQEQPRPDSWPLWSEPENKSTWPLSEICQHRSCVRPWNL